MNTAVAAGRTPTPETAPAADGRWQLVVPRELHARGMSPAVSAAHISALSVIGG